MLHTLLLNLLQKALTDYQAQDVSIAQQLQKVQGKWLKLTFEELPQPFYIQAGEQLILAEHCSTEPDSSITLSVFTLPQLAQSADLSALIKHDSLTLKGDAQLAAKVVDVLRHCHFEPEEWLASKIGDAPAYLIHRNMLKLLATGKRWKHETEQDIQEWLQDEAKLSPSAIEVEQFKRTVANTQDAVDALALRIHALTLKN